jgi:hypothetical protein
MLSPQLMQAVGNVLSTLVSWGLGDLIGGVLLGGFGLRFMGQAQ